MKKSISLALFGLTMTLSLAACKTPHVVEKKHEGEKACSCGKEGECGCKKEECSCHEGESHK